MAPTASKALQLFPESSPHQGVALRASHWNSLHFLFEGLETVAGTHPEPHAAPSNLEGG